MRADYTAPEPPHPAGAVVPDRGDHDATGAALEATPSPPASEPSVALARALELAAGAGQWGVVAQLGKELEARRLARAGNVVELARRRTRGEG